ncbi:MAG: hypothetical protein ACLPY1_12555 [Terracidiphilus sp.]
MSKNNLVAALGFILLAGAGLSRADGQDYHKAPLGVYAHVSVDNAIKAYRKYRKSGGNEDEHTYLRMLYYGMLNNNPGVAGITFGIYWDRVQKSDPDCASLQDCKPGTDENGDDWSYLDDVFTEAEATGKQVQLILTPGVDSPSWLFDRLLPTCDTLFGAGDPVPVPNCGFVTFSKFPEVQHADGHRMPLPWSTIYQYWWQQFLIEVNNRYEDHKDFAAIAIAGPICASTEMILPTTLNGSRQSPGVKADHAWSTLIGNSYQLSSYEYQHSDKIFVEQWVTAIQTYEEIFKNVTLFLSPDSGDDFPEFNDKTIENPSWLFTADCSTALAYPMSCDAKTQILTYFLSTQNGRQLATQVGGMTASSAVTPETGDTGIGVGGVKVLTGLPNDSQWPFLGGAEFDWSVTTDILSTREGQGCTQAERMAKECKGISPELAAYNTLAVFFYGTEFEDYYGWPQGTPATGPMQWVDIDFTDIVWAQTNGPSSSDDGVPCNLSLQELVNKASWDLFYIANQPPPVPAPRLPPGCE